MIWIYCTFIVFTPVINKHKSPKQDSRKTLEGLSVLEISVKGLFPGTVKHIAAEILTDFAWTTVYFLLFADL